MKTFQASHYLTRKEKHELAMSLNLKERSIENWYCRTRRNKAADGTFSPSELCSIIHYQSTLINTYTNYWLSNHSLYLVTVYTHTDPCKLAHTHTHTHTDIHTRQHTHTDIHTCFGSCCVTVMINQVSRKWEWNEENLLSILSVILRWSLCKWTVRNSLCKSHCLHHSHWTERFCSSTSLFLYLKWSWT